MNRTPYAVVIGAANIDILGCSHRKLQPSDSNPGSISYSSGGVGRNIAENLARLGSDTRLISVVGKDTFGQLIVEQCQQAGVDTTNILQLNNVPTSAYLSVLNDQNDLHVAINDMAILDHLTVDTLKSHHNTLQQAKLLVIDTNLPDQVLAFLFSNYPSIPRFVDTVSCNKALRIKPWLSAIHTLKPNLAEAEALSGIKAKTQADLHELTHWFHHQGVGRVFLSLGADGVFYSDKNDHFITPALPATMVNANGAGDAFMAGLAHAYVQDWPRDKTLQFAMAASVLALSDLATINPAISETSVNRLIKESPSTLK